MSTGVNRSKSKKYGTFLRDVIEGQVKSTSHFYQMQESPSQRRVDEVVVGLCVAVRRVLFIRTATTSTIPFLTPTPNSGRLVIGSLLVRMPPQTFLFICVNLRVCGGCGYVCECDLGKIFIHQHPSIVRSIRIYYIGLK